MSVSVLQSAPVANGNATTVTATFAGAVLSGSTVIVLATNFLAAISDNKGNVYQPAVRTAFGGDVSVVVWYALKVVGGSSFAVTSTFGSAQFCSLSAIECAGLLAPPYGFSTGGGSSTTATGGPIATGIAGSLVVGIVNSLGAAAIAAPSGGWTQVFATQTDSDSEAAYQVFSDVQSAVNPSWTVPNAHWSAALVSFYQRAEAYAPEIAAGPPLRGAPWLARLPWELGAPPPPPAPFVRPPIYAPEIFAGPPLRGAPWLARLPHEPASVQSRGGAAPAPSTRSRGKPFIERVNDPRRDSEVERLRRHTEKVAMIFNSLLAQGYIVQTAPSTFQLRTGGLVYARDPGAADDGTAGVLVGEIWINSLTQAVWVCVSNAAGSALWKLVS